MGEYNIKYLELKRRLNVLKLSSDNKDLLLCIDALLKELDNRYSDEKQLESVEEKLESIEK